MTRIQLGDVAYPNEGFYEWYKRVNDGEDSYRFGQCYISGWFPDPFEEDELLIEIHEINGVMMSAIPARYVEIPRLKA